MKKAKFIQKGILFFLIMIGGHTGAQIILKPDPKVTFNRSKGIAVISSSTKGSFYLNEHLLTELKGKDTIYIINITPGEYKAKVVSGNGLTKKNITIIGGKVIEIQPGIDSVHIKNNAFFYDDIEEKVTGKYVFLLHNSYFNITQIGLYSAQFGESSKDVANRWFRTLTTINGFQVSPGFCAGIGISYNNYEIPAVYNSNYYYSNNQYPQTVAVFNHVSFLPFFVDIRCHLSGRRFAPFIKLDIGYNILLAKKSMSVYEANYIGGKLCTMQMVGGGICFSPGIGFRIAVTKLIQVIASMEYSYEKSRVMLTNGTTGNPVQNIGLNWIKFNIGIGFQKR
jgi:hypothetical protein